MTLAFLRAYKIVKKAEWTSQMGRVPPRFTGAGIDIADGYIHMSRANQVKDTATKFFSGQNDVMLVAVSLGDIKHGEVRWEVASNDEMYPHLYGGWIDLDCIVWTTDLPWTPTGFVYPIEIK